MSLPEPAHRLPESAKGYWRVAIAGRALAAVAACLALADAWDELGIPALVPVWVALGVGTVAAAVVPGLRWRRWRYEIREEEIDLRHGTFTVRRTLVPIRRVQHVDTSSGLLQGAFDLATVSFHTAAGETELPALARGEAEAVRRRIGELARTRDDV